MVNGGLLIKLMMVMMKRLSADRNVSALRAVQLSRCPLTALSCFLLASLSTRLGSAASVCTAATQLCARRAPPFCSGRPVSASASQPAS